MKKKKNLFSFGTKAETLERLKEKINLDIFCRQFFFSFKDWSKNRENILKHISQKFINERIVVRSVHQLKIIKTKAMLVLTCHF